jgi:transposase
MKKITTFLCLIMFTTLLFSQKIEIIDYGDGYRSLKNLSYYDFKDVCKNKSINNCYGTVFPHMLKTHNGFEYLCSKFAFELQRKNRSLAQEYADVLAKLGNESNAQWWNSSNKYDIAFKTGSKWAFQYLQLIIERFEIISEYYKNVYNYQISKEIETNEISKLAQNIKDSITALPPNDSLYIITQNNLDLLKIQRDKSILQLTGEYDEKVEKLEFIKKQKIDILPIENYTNNRKAVLDEYDPIILKLRNEQKIMLKDNDVYWKDKILVKEQELLKINSNYKAEIGNRILIEQERKRKEYIETGNLIVLREQFEEKYQSDLKLINAKIEEHIKRN